MPGAFCFGKVHGRPETEVNPASRFVSGDGQEQKKPVTKKLLLSTAALPLYRYDHHYRDFSRYPGLPEW